MVGSGSGSTQTSPPSGAAGAPESVQVRAEALLAALQPWVTAQGASLRLRLDGVYRRAWIGAHQHYVGQPASPAAPVCVRGFAGPGWSLAAAEVLARHLPSALEGGARAIG